MRKIFPRRGARPRRALRPRHACADRFDDPRAGRVGDRRQSRRGPQPARRPTAPDAPDAARALMHGIFVGEIQALEGAGRTCWDFDDRQRRRRGAVRAQARHGPPVLGRGPPRRDLA